MTEHASTAADAVSVTVQGHVGIIEFRRPPANYFDVTLIRSLADAAHALDDDPGCRALVLCSQGKHFCAGADFASGGTFGEDRAAGAEALYREAARLFEIRTPVVAAVQGAAIGGGLGLACAADFRVADPATRFVANFTRLAIHPGFGLSVTLPAIVGQQRAADLMLRGGSVSGEQARDMGLADRLAPVGEQRRVAVEMAEDLAAAAPLAVASLRETLRGDLANRVRTALQRELAEQARLWMTRDAAEGLAAAAERRTPSFRGA